MRKDFFKKTVFMCLTLIVGIIGFHFTFCAFALLSQIGFSLFGLCLMSNLGVLLPVIALEVAKLLCFKRKNRGIYAFDIFGISISTTALAIYISWCAVNDLWQNVWGEFFLVPFPWIVSFVLQGLLCLLKWKKNRQNKENTENISTLKKAIFIGLTISIGYIGFYFTFLAMYQALLGELSLFVASLLSNLGVILPIMVLEIAKILCLKRDNRKIYVFDVFGVSISSIILAIIILFYVLLAHLLKYTIKGFFVVPFPWIVALIIQGSLLMFKKSKISNDSIGEN